MATAFQRVLARYGQTVEVLPGGEDRERWLYLGEPDVSLELGEDGFVRAGGRTYTVYSARRVDLGKETCHWWAILLPREEER